MGSSGGSRPEEVNFDSSQLQQELTGLRDPNSQEAMAIQQMIGGQLPESVSNAYAMQQKASQGGIERARTTAQQTVREGAASRGMFSSDIALGAEAGAMAGVEQQFAQRQADIYGQQAGQIQSGILSGLGFSQGRQSLRGNLAGSIASGQFQASQANAQMQNQWQQGQQQMGLGLANIAGGTAGFMFGGPAGAVAGSQLGGS